METVVQNRPASDVKSVALKAFANIIAQWSVAVPDAAGLADMSVSTWKRAKKPGYAGELTHDQMLRLSAVVGIYKSLELYFDTPLSRRWVTLPNTGPLFGGATPLATMIGGGLPHILQVRAYLDALRGGA